MCVSLLTPPPPKADGGGIGFISVCGCGCVCVCVHACMHSRLSKKKLMHRFQLNFAHPRMIPLNFQGHRSRSQENFQRKTCSHNANREGDKFQWHIKGPNGAMVTYWHSLSLHIQHTQVIINHLNIIMMYH